MKKRLFLVMVFGFAVLVVSAQTQAPPSTPNSPTFSEQDKAAAKKELEKVGEMFGVKKPEAPIPAKTEDKDVTMAEVADKALTMVGNAVGTIAGIVQKVAPEVWEIMVRQQYAAALGMLIGPFLFLLINAAYVVTVKKYWKKWGRYDSDDYTTEDWLTEKGMRAILTTLVPGIVAMIFAGILAYRVGDALPMLINPKYYAVRDLLQMLLK